MENLRFKNQSGLLDVEKLNTPVLVVGAGAIGSFYVMTLAKMGFKDILVYDSDKIEDHNIANQMYPEYYKGMEKVEALQKVTDAYAGVKIKFINKFWHPDNAQIADIVVMATDNMDARIAIWNYYKDKENVRLIVDGRMGAQVSRAYSVDMSKNDEKAFYQSTLYPQKDATPDRCTMKSIIFTVLGVGSDMLSMTKQFVMNEPRPSELIRDYVNHTLFPEFVGRVDPTIEENEQPGEVGGANAPESGVGQDQPQGSNEVIAQGA